MPNFLTATTISSTDFMAVIDALKAQISVGTVVEVLGVLAGACVGFAFMWWGVRKVSGALMKAFKKGKISL